MGWFKNDDSARQHLSFEAGRARLCEMLNLVSTVAATAQRDELRGVLFQTDGKVCRLVATDGCRLLVTQSEIVCTSGGKGRFFISLETLSKVAGGISGDHERLSVLIKDGTISFGGESYPLQDAAKYPDYQKVMPQRFSGRLFLDRGQFLFKLSQLRSSMNREKPNVALSLSKGLIKMSVPGTQSSEEMPVDYKGSNVTLGVNPAYFDTILEKAPSGQAGILLEFSSPDQPLVFQWENTVYMVMPVVVS